MADLQSIDDKTFETEVASSDVPFLVDFWAEWCHPCHLLAPEVEGLAQEQSSRLRVVKLNIDENPSIAGKFGVMSIPTLILFVDGQEKARIIGVRRKDAILAEIEPHLQAS